MPCSCGWRPSTDHLEPSIDKPSAPKPRRARAGPTSALSSGRLARKIGKKEAAVAGGHSILIIALARAQ